MSEAIELAAELRTELGTGAARALRKEGRVPAIIYGAGKNPVSISIEEKEITKLYRKPQFISTLLSLEINKKHHKVLPKAVELHPITEIVRHVDFVFLEEKMQKMEVPLVFEGKEKSIGIKRGGFFNVVKRTLTMSCPVDNLPRKVVVDVSSMYVGQSIKASAVKLPEGCVLLVKPESVIASMTGRGGKGDAEEAAAAAAK